jgi:hypothetical protein
MTGSACCDFIFGLAEPVKTEFSVPIAVAGGSDNRPPTDPPAEGEIIQFPLDRVRKRDGGDDGETGPLPCTTDDVPPPAPASASPSDGALWALWMTGVLGPREARVGP